MAANRPCDFSFKGRVADGRRSIVESVVEIDESIKYLRTKDAK